MCRVVRPNYLNLKWGVSTHKAPIANAAEPVEPIQEASEYTEDPVSLEEVEKKMISLALERHGGRRKQTAEELKISEWILYRKIKEYRLE